MVLDDLLGDANDFADFAIGETVPDLDCDLNLGLSHDLFRSKALAKVRRSQGVMTVLPAS